MLVVIRAVIVGLLVGMIAANIWPLLLLSLGMPIAAGAEIVFLALAATIHAALVLLFRIVPFPAAAFHQGYDFSFIRSDRSPSPVWTERFNVEVVVFAVVFIVLLIAMRHLAKIQAAMKK